MVGLNVTQVTGRGAQVGIQVGGPRGVGSYTVDMLPKAKLELVVRDDQTQQAIDIIMANSRTGDVGDGEDVAEIRGAGGGSGGEVLHGAP